MTAVITNPKHLSLGELKEAAEKLALECRLASTEGEIRHILQGHEARAILHRLHLVLEQPLPERIANHLAKYQCEECAFAIAFT